MKNWKHFVIPLVSAIIIIRIFLLFLSPENLLYTDKFHHAYIGILILFITGLIYHIRKKINIIFFGMGLGMLIDEIFLFFSKGNCYYKYWSKLSIYGTTILIITTIGIYFIFAYIKSKRIKA